MPLTQKKKLKIKMNFTLTQIDRGIFEALRLALVEANYLPDILVHTTENDYNNALQTIKSNGKIPVNLYGVGSWKAKQKLQFNTIIIERKERNLSPLGYRGMSITSKKINGIGFETKKIPFETTELKYNIVLVCEDVKNERELHSIIMNTFDVFKELKGLNDDGSFTEDTFLLMGGNVINTSDADIIEVQFRYKTSELILLDIKTLDGNVAELQNINIDI
jgi:hypothetical protein